MSLTQRVLITLGTLNLVLLIMAGEKITGVRKYELIFTGLSSSQSAHNLEGIEYEE